MQSHAQLSKEIAAENVRLFSALPRDIWRKLFNLLPEPARYNLRSSSRFFSTHPDLNALTQLREWLPNNIVCTRQGTSFICDDGALIVNTESSLWQRRGRLYQTFVDNVLQDPNAKVVQVINQEAVTLLLMNDGEMVYCKKALDGKKLSIWRNFYHQNVKRIISSNNSVFLFMDNHDILATGDNQYGELGTGNFLKVEETPCKISLASNVSIIQVSVGINCSYFLSSTGTIYACGANFHGQLGVGEKNKLYKTPTPVLIKLPCNDHAIKIFAGHNTAFCITSSGALFGWGLNSKGQLGVGDLVVRFEPTLIEMPDKVFVKKVTVGEGVAHCLTTCGRLFVLGKDVTGKCNTRPTEVMLPDNLKAKQIYGGPAHIFCLTRPGRLFAWGLSRTGALVNPANRDGIIEEPTEVKEFIVRDGQLIFSEAENNITPDVPAAPAECRIF